MSQTSAGARRVAAQIAAVIWFAAPSSAWATWLVGSDRSVAICCIDRPPSTPGEKLDPETTILLATSMNGSQPGMRVRRHVVGPHHRRLEGVRGLELLEPGGGVG